MSGLSRSTSAGTRLLWLSPWSSAAPIGNAPNNPPRVSSRREAPAQSGERPLIRPLSIPSNNDPQHAHGRGLARAWRRRPKCPNETAPVRGDEAGAILGGTARGRLATFGYQTITSISPPLFNFAQIGLRKEGTDAPSWTTKASSIRSYRQPIQPALNGPWTWTTTGSRRACLAQGGIPFSRRSAPSKEPWAHQREPSKTVSCSLPGQRC